MFVVSKYEVNSIIITAVLRNYIFPVYAYNSAAYDDCIGISRKYVIRHNFRYNDGINFIFGHNKHIAETNVV